MSTTPSAQLARREALLEAVYDKLGVAPVERRDLYRVAFEESSDSLGEEASELEVRLVAIELLLVFIRRSLERRKDTATAMHDAEAELGRYVFHYLTRPEARADLLAQQKRRRTRPSAQPATTASEAFLLGRAFAAVGWLGEMSRPGVWRVRCPSERLHQSGNRYDGATLLYAPSTEQPGGWKAEGSFRCGHQACQQLRDAALVVRAVEAEAARDAKGSAERRGDPSRSP